MQVLPISAFSDNYIWLIVDDTGQQAFCVDPGEAKPVIDFLTKESINLQAILLTHHHHDHIGGVQELIDFAPGIEVYGPKDSRIPNLSRIIQGGELLILPPCQFQVLATPGHTATHISLYEPLQGWLFCGDTLFSAGCGRVFDGSMEQLHASLQQYKALPDDTAVYCAHEYTRHNLRFAATVEPENLDIRNHAFKLLEHVDPCSLPSSIGLEKQINPFLRTQIETVKKYAEQQGVEQTDSLSVFKQIRLDKDNFP